MTEGNTGTRITRPVVLDETGQRIARALEDMAYGSAVANRVVSLNDTKLFGGVIQAGGLPVYVSDLTLYENYGLTETGWYVFARIMTPLGVITGGGTSVSGAAGAIIPLGGDHVDVAVRFGATVELQRVVVNWGDVSEVFVFDAPDLAIHNLDYRVTFYIYPLEEYAIWSYALTTDATFVADKQYYTKDENDVYTLAEVTAGQAVTANTYYNHSKLHLEGMTRNVTYKLDAIVDCPVEIALPEVADDGYGAWFEMQMRYSGSFSCTLLPPEGVKVGTAQTQSQTAGINTVDLQYTEVGGVKMWTLLNTHANIPT